MYVGKEVFQEQLDREKAKELFYKSVGRVEIETHSFCNRRCNYCPNVSGDRLSENKRISPQHWQKILANLAEIDYKRNLVFQSYNEPLADRNIIECISQARAACPKSRIMIYTNGDYLDEEYLEELSYAGLNYMHVSIHTRYNGKYSEVDSLNLISKLIKRTNCDISFKSFMPNQHIIANIPHDHIEIDVRAINFFDQGNNRGGLVDAVPTPPVRTAPCHFPFAHFYVGFSGNVIPCCHVRSDVDAHAHYLWGNLSEYDSIFQAWASEQGAQWRRHLISLEPKKSPCDTCSASFLSNDPKVLNQVKLAWERHVK